ncbi:MAG: decaprenyl-phosphate phosphoribosyltransferase [Chloroflexi bacterium]|nr:decaprenyl-phosphate phosphoribosyltransferase [Chloroflexota bacterium]
MLKPLIQAMRPRQWDKNFLLYLPFVFTLRQVWQPFTEQMYSLFLTATAAFVIFCALSGVVYLINDLLDVEKDRLHPTKRFRPIASGALPRAHAKTASIALIVVALPLAFWLDAIFGLIALTYFALMVLYSFRLKHIILVDVFTVAFGFVLRAVAGAAAIHVRASPWLFVCTLLVALFVSFGKRRHELILLDDNASEHRAILKEYTPQVLDQMISVTAGTFVMAYSLYTFSAENLPRNNAMMLTIPFALYVIFRLLYLIHVKNEGGSPEEMILRDKPLLASILLWGGMSAAILYFFGRV